MNKGFVGARIFITGIVQGVGFRPHVFNIAQKFGIKGFVLNDSRGVLIEAEGKKEKVDGFYKYLMENPPKLAMIYKIEKKYYSPLKGYREFTIRKSEKAKSKNVLISPDIGICEDCIRELYDPKDRRYMYPFINCTNCGPRYTIIKDVPYDRHNTTMKPFTMCDFCKKQYEDPTDRRFHAQPIACPVCGPHLALKNKEGKNISKEDVEIIKKTSLLLDKGYIIAIKGLGGYHLAVDATNERAVSRLREKKLRKGKPFAIMVLDVEEAKKYCCVSPEEEKLLCSFKAPIVLMKKKENTSIAPSVAPSNKYLGVMLPYTPLHHLLLREFRKPLVMTSGNISDEPIFYKDKEAFSGLKKVADYFLTHNREIHIRCEDSVVRVFEKKPYFIRRSRGYAPFPIILSQKASTSVLSTGGELKNTFCLYRNHEAFLSPHIGDLENYASFKSFEEGITHFQRIFGIEPKIVSYDPHPRYLSTQYAMKLAIPKVPVYHHHAHTTSVMADLGITEDVIGVSLDGVGYGKDEKLWGFEFLKANLLSFERLIHLKYIPLPGGEKAIKEPWRMAISYLFEVFGEDVWNLEFLDIFSKIKEIHIKQVIKMIEKGINSSLISSAGRLFDAISSILGIQHISTFEGEAAIKMEMIAEGEGIYPFEILEEEKGWVIDPAYIITGVVNDVRKGILPRVISAKFHNTVALIILEGVKKIYNIYGIKNVILSGGVFQNIYLLERCAKLLRQNKFTPLIPKRVPLNDGGISLGQAIVASERAKKGLLEGY